MRKIGNAIQNYYGQLNISASGTIPNAASGALALTVLGAANSSAMSVTGTDIAQITLGAAAAANRSIFVMQQAGSTIARFGVDGSNILLSDSTNGDLCFVSVGQSVRIGTSAGGTTRLLVASAGNVTIAAPTSGNTLSVIQQGVNNAINISATGNATNGAGQLSFDSSGNMYLQSTVANTALNIGNFVTGSSLALVANSATRLAINSTGNVTISTPTSGTTLTINAAVSNVGLQITTPATGTGQPIQISGAAATQLNVMTFAQGAQSSWTIYQTASDNNMRLFNGADRVIFNPAGNVTINIPSSGAALTINGVANSNTALIQASSTASQSFGLDCRGGTNASDYSAVFRNQSAGSVFLQIFGDGGVTVGAPTGGDKGLGTINATGLFVNGVAVGSGAVSSVTGTANQVTASPTTGAVVVSLPNNVVIPTVSTGTALTVSVTSTAAAAAFSSSGSISGIVTISGTGTSGTVLSLTSSVNNSPSLVIDSTAANGSLAIWTNSGAAIAYAGSAKVVVASGLLADFAIASVGKFILGTNTTVAAVTIGTGGGVIVGAATDQGAGTLAALTQLYVGTTPMYRTGTFTGTFTGVSTGTTGTVTYVIMGKVATLTCAQAGTSNATTFTMTGLPAILQPATLAVQVCSLGLEDNSLEFGGLAVISAGSGTITFQREVSATGAFDPNGFTASGVKGMNQSTITYLLI